MDEIQIELARYAHDAWAGWTKYTFDQSKRVSGVIVIPADLVARWERQIETSYDNLPIDEQASDLVEAERILEIMNTRAPALCLSLDLVQGEADPCVERLVEAARRFIEHCENHWKLIDDLATALAKLEGEMKDGHQ
jgi:phage portal protein BeeE